MICSLLKSLAEPISKDSYFNSLSALSTSSRTLLLEPLLIATTSPLTGDVNFTRSLYLSKKSTEPVLT